MARVHLSAPVILPFRAPARADEPDTIIEDDFDIGDVKYRLVLRVWTDDTYSAELINLASGVSYPRCGAVPGRDGRSPAEASAQVVSLR